MPQQGAMGELSTLRLELADDKGPNPGGRRALLALKSPLREGLHLPELPQMPGEHGDDEDPTLTSVDHAMHQHQRLAQLTLSDGAVKTFEMSIDKFNALRYNVAKVLREMANLEGHPIMHIMSELEQDQKAKQKASR